MRIEGRAFGEQLEVVGAMADSEHADGGEMEWWSIGVVNRSREHSIP